MKVRWLNQAFASLEQEISKISETDNYRAVDTYNEIIGEIKQLSISPSIGNIGRVFGTKELVVKSCQLMFPYRVKDDEIQILRTINVR